MALKHGTRTVPARIDSIEGRIDFETLEWPAADELRLNDIAHVRLRLGGEIAADAYAQCHATGAFILVDESSTTTPSRRGWSRSLSEPMTRLDVPPTPAKATDGLAHDTELLSATLNEVLEEQAGRVFASRLQWLFRTAAAVRAGDETAVERLVTYLRGVPDESVEPIIRACSLELQLANIAEERERVRRRRQYDATGEVQRESLAETAEILRRNGVDVAPLAAQLEIEHVLTAHPTEATRRSVLDHQWDVAKLLDRLDDPRTGKARRRALVDAAARDAHRVVADRRAAARAPEGRGRGPAQPLLLRGGAVRRRAGRAGRDRARARRPAGPAGALATAPGPAATWTGTPRSARTRWPARCSCTASPRCGCCGCAWTTWRACSRTPRCGSRSRWSSRSR